jgi:phage-related protein
MILPEVEIELHDEVVARLLGLNDSEWDRVVMIVDRLAALGSAARMPLPRSLGDGLFELRFSLGSTARRITYRFTQDGRVVLLTTFRKQRQNERPEVARAKRAAELCAQRYP